MLSQLGRLSVDDTRPAPEVVTPTLGTFAVSGPFSCLDAAVEASRNWAGVWVCSTKLGTFGPRCSSTSSNSQRTLNQEQNAVGGSTKRLPVERQFRDEDLFGRAESERALVRSQSGPGSGVALSGDFEHVRFHPL